MKETKNVEADVPTATPSNTIADAISNSSMANATNFRYLCAVTYTQSHTVIGHTRSGVVYNFGRVSLSVCPMYVCNTITFESLEVGSSYLHIRYISREYGSGSYMVIGSRSSSQEQKR